MVKRAIFIIVIVLIGAYFVNSYLERKAKENSERAEAKRIEDATKASVAEMVARTKAIDNWQAKLSKGEKIRLEPIFTVELERLWLTDSPILFLGAIKDIATLDNENYTIKINQNLFNNPEYIFGTQLELELRYPKQKVDLFLEQHPDIFKNFGFKNGVAVVAEIENIETITISGSEGELEEVKSGKGKCIDMLYTGDVIF
jgi:hypothetical protein